MKTGNGDKVRRQKSREVSSRYLSPISAAESPWLMAPTSPNHNQTLSPNRQKPQSKHKHTGFIRGLWPSSTPQSSKSQKGNPTPTAVDMGTTLADHLGNERRKDGGKNNENSVFLSKQRSCSEFGRFEKSSKKQSSLKENHKPIFGSGSMRYSGKLRFPGRSSTSSSSSSSSTSSSKSSEFLDSNEIILPGRMSVDENALRRRSYSRMRSGSFSDDSECSDLGSPFTTGKNFLASYMAPTLSSRKSGIEIPSRYMNPSIPVDNSPKKSTLKNAMKRANSLTLNSKWGSSPGRSGSPPTSSLFSNSKPPTSPSRAKTFLHLGLDLIKGKKGDSASGCLLRLGTGTGSGSGSGSAESAHQLRMMHDSWMQWRYTNARAEVVNENIATQAQNNLLYAREGLAKLRQSVVQKRLQLEKEKLEMKLNFLLHSQMELLEAWGDMERQHTMNVSMTKDCLHAVVCRIPLVEGAKMDPQSALVAIRHASDLASAVKSMLSSLLPTADETVSTLSDLAEIAAQEKLLLEECLEHFQVISTLEIEEKSLRCSLIEMNSMGEQQLQQQIPS